VQIDDLAWLAVAAALTVVGMAATFVLWRRRGPASGLRALAWTLLPAAAYLTGTLRLVARVVDAAVVWATSLVFNPLMWVGVAVAGVAALLFVVAGGMRRRGIGTRKKRREVSADAASTGTGRSPAQQPARPDDDMADIEAILRKHGIS
jgi:hypothetical protein